MLWGAAGAVLLAVSPVDGVRAQEALSKYAQPALRDFSVTGSIVQKNDAELRKIDNSFVQAYRFRESLIQYKEPMKLRIDSKAGLLTVRYVINGNRKSTQVPGLRINKVKDITGRPGEQQSMLDSGILTPGFLADGVASRFVGMQTLDGRKVPVFEFWYTDERNSRHHFVWIDPAKRFVLRHDVHHRSGGLKMRFVFQQPKQIAGIWVPTRVGLYNAENRLAAITRYDKIKVNTGLSESLFRI
jgi:hypothetical protein